MKGKLKQNRKKKKGNEVLQKYMVAMDEFIKSKSGTEEVETDHGMRFVKRKSRKELRKEKRKMKKAKMKCHYEGKKPPSLLLSGGKNSGIPADKEKRKVEKAKKEVSTAHSSKSIIGHTEKTDDTKTPSSPRKRKKTNKLQESRKMALMEANEEEDREIKKLERCLGLNKRKNKKTIPQSFVADGLDYILGVLDSGSSAVGMYDDDDDVDMAKENFEKLDESDSDLSHEDENPGEEMASEGSDEDMSSSNDDDEEEDDDDAMGDEEEEAEGNAMDDDSDAADSDDENEAEAEHEADAPETKTPASEIETVSREIF